MEPNHGYPKSSLLWSNRPLSGHLISFNYNRTAHYDIMFSLSFMDVFHVSACPLFFLVTTTATTTINHYSQLHTTTMTTATTTLGYLLACFFNSLLPWLLLASLLALLPWFCVLAGGSKNKARKSACWLFTCLAASNAHCCIFGRTIQ